MKKKEQILLLKKENTKLNQEIYLQGKVKLAMLHKKNSEIKQLKGEIDFFKNRQIAFEELGASEKIQFLCDEIVKYMSVIDQTKLTIVLR